MTKKKKHHYIPRFYLAYFTNKNRNDKEVPFLWVYKKSSRIPFKKSPQNIGFENYFYAYDNGSQVSFEIEDILAAVESDVAFLLKNLLQSDFNFNDVKKRFILGKFVSFMNYRTVRSREHFRILLQNKLKERFMEKVDQEGGLDKYLRQHNKPWTASEFIDSFNAIKLVPQKVLALEHMLQAVKKTLPHLCIRNWTFLISGSPNCFFITSDSPVLLYNEGIQDDNFIPGFLDKKTDIIFPLSPTMCLYASFNVRDCFWKIPESAVKVINKKIADSCHKYYFSSSHSYERLF